MNLAEYYASLHKYDGALEHPEWVALQTKVAHEKTCTYWTGEQFCEAEAVIYPAGWRCPEHTPTSPWSKTVEVG